MGEIQHFLHEHPLSLIRKGNEQVFCNGCKERLSGTTYGCTKCMFFLHKSCFELQPTIQNFFHPCPLVLNISSVDGYYCYGCFNRGGGFRYICKYKCGFQMHVDCALNPPIAKDDQTLLHVTHRHPLKTVDLNKSDRVGCAICEKLCFDSVYGCEICGFFIHNTCMATIPRQVNHLFHPCPLILSTYPHMYACAGCDDHKPRSSLTFSCEKCYFRLDAKCALLPTLESPGACLIQHFTHRHPLKLVDSYNEDVKTSCCCDVCGELRSGSAYICKKCNFYGHKSCITEAPRQINHSFHPCPLTVVTIAHYRCRGCDEECLGFSFCCGKCNFYLDGKCAFLPTANSEHAKEIQHFTHQHPLSLLQETKDRSCIQVRCKACGENWPSTAPRPIYGCTRCTFSLHRSCAIELAPKPREIRHFSHTKHPLTLSFLPHKDATPCGACCKKFDSLLLAYRCSNCDFNLHIDCVRHLPFVKYSAHRHLLTLFDNANHLTCHICNDNVGNFVLRCVLCNFNMHLQCHPSTPKTIDHQCHVHPLSLTKSPFQFELNSAEDAYNSDDEFYCDVCEGKRYKRDWVYYCEECKFIAEIRCVMDKVLPPLKADHGDQKTLHGEEIHVEEENISAIDLTLSKIDEEIEKLRLQREPLESESKQLEEQQKAVTRKLEDIKAKIGSITDQLEALQVERYMHQHKYSN